MNIDQELDKLLWRGTARDKEVRKIIKKLCRDAYRRGKEAGMRSVERSLYYPNIW